MRKNISLFTILVISAILLVPSGSLPFADATFATPIKIIDSTGDGTNGLALPYGIAVDSVGNVYVSGRDTDNVFKITPGGDITEIITGASGLKLPYSIAIDSNDNIYVVGYFSDNVYRIDAEGGKPTEIINFSNGLDGPQVITIDSNDNVYVTGLWSDNAFKITPLFEKTEIITSASGLDRPYGIAVDSTGNVYVAGNISNNVYKISSSGQVSEIINKDSFGVDTLKRPQGLAIDSNDIVYVAGFSSDNVLKIDASNDCSTHVEDPPCIVTEIINAAGGGHGEDDTLNGAVGLAIDSNNNVYVSATNSDNVFEITPEGVITEIFNRDGDGNGTVDGIYGIAVDSAGNVYVTANRIPHSAFKITITSDTTTTTDTKNGSNSNKHLTKPTFGVDHKTHIQKIEGGFTFNDESFDVTDNFWTPFDKQTIKIGETNSFSAKVFVEHPLRVQEFLFGIPEIGAAHKAELYVEIHYDYLGEIEEIKGVQVTDIIDMDTLTVERYPSKCLPSEDDEKCITTLISIKFLEPLKDDVMAIKAIDYKNRVTTTYLNDGFDISGKSLNPMITNMIPGTEKYEGLITVTQSAKYSEIWIAEDGREFQRNSYDTFTQINNDVYERLIDTKEIKKRNHSEFYTLINYEINRAQIVHEQLCDHCSDEPYAEINDIFAYDYPIIIPKSEDPRIQAVLIIENIKAQQILDKK